MRKKKKKRFRDEQYIIGGWGKAAGAQGGGCHRGLVGANGGKAGCHQGAGGAGKSSVP